MLLYGAAALLGGSDHFYLYFTSENLHLVDFSVDYCRFGIEVLALFLTLLLVEEPLASPAGKTQVAFVAETRVIPQHQLQHPYFSSTIPAADQRQ